MELKVFNITFFFLLQAVLKSPMPSRLIAPAPASNQGHIPIPPKVPGHITVTIESNTTTPSIPVATISGQQVSAAEKSLS